MKTPLPHSPRSAGERLQTVTELVVSSSLLLLLPGKDTCHHSTEAEHAVPGSRQYLTAELQPFPVTSQHQRKKSKGKLLQVLLHTLGISCLAGNKGFQGRNMRETLGQHLGKSMHFPFVKTMFRLKAMSRITPTSLPAQEPFLHNPGSPTCRTDHLNTLGHKLSKDVRKGKELVSNLPQCHAYFVHNMGDRVYGKGVGKGHTSFL